jgi:hypothetical protein
MSSLFARKAIQPRFLSSPPRGFRGLRRLGRSRSGQRLTRQPPRDSGSAGLPQSGLGAGGDGRRAAAVADRRPKHRPGRVRERATVADLAPAGLSLRPLLQQVGRGTVFREAGCKDPSGSEACEGRSTRLQAPGLGQFRRGRAPTAARARPALIEADRWRHRAHRSGSVELHDTTAPWTRF